MLDQQHAARAERAASQSARLSDVTSQDGGKLGRVRRHAPAATRPARAPARSAARISASVVGQHAARAEAASATAELRHRQQRHLVRGASSKPIVGLRVAHRIRERAAAGHQTTRPAAASIARSHGRSSGEPAWLPPSLTTISRARAEVTGRTGSGPRRRRPRPHRSRVRSIATPTMPEPVSSFSTRTVTRDHARMRQQQRRDPLRQRLDQRHVPGIDQQPDAVGDEVVGEHVAHVLRRARAAARHQASTLKRTRCGASRSRA